MWLKRLNAPKFWRQEPKKYKYSICPSCGPHPKNYCIPLGIIVRDILKYAENLKEAKHIIKQKKVLVDQRVVTDYKFPCGLFDVISFPEISEHYRISANENGLYLVKINEEEANFKILKVKKKTKISSDTYQLTFHDGKNILTKDNSIKPHDSLLVELFPLKMLNHLKFEENSTGFVFKGNNAGKFGRIVKIVNGGINKKWIVEIKTEDEKISTVRDYVIIVGKEKSLISI